MSYYSNNPLTFPSYNQNQIPQRSLSTLSGVSGQPKEAQLNPNRGTHQLNAAHNSLPLPTQHQQQQQQEQHQQNAIRSMNQGAAHAPPNNANSDDKPQRKERKNRPGQKFGAKKKSWVWSWFVQDSQDPNVAACDYCGKIITRLASDKGSPKKLSEHLKTHKLNRESINSSRPIPIDGNGITYAPNGVPLNFSNSYNPNTSSNSSNREATGTSQTSAPPASESLDSKRKKQTATPQSNYNLNNNRRFLSTDFDNSPYSSMKFHKHLLKFLTENKLSINVIKSHSFQQLIYDLRSDSVTELLELTSLYSSLLEVSRFDSNGADNTSMPTIDEASVANTIAHAVEQKANGNVN